MNQTNTQNGFLSALNVQTLPKQLLSPSSFKHHMSASNLDKNFLNMPNSILRNQLNASHNDDPIKKRSVKLKKSANQARTAYRSFDFSARHFGSLCDKNFHQTTSLHQSQKFGYKGGRYHRLQPLEKQRLAQGGDDIDPNVVKNFTLSQLASTNRQIKNQDTRTLIKQVIAYGQSGMIMTLRTFELEVFQKEKEGQFAKAKDRLILKVNMSDSIFLVRHNFSKINYFFSRCIIFDEANHQISLDFDQFENCPSISNPLFKSYQDTYPAQMTQDIKSIQGGTEFSLHVRFPFIQFYLPDLLYSQKQVLNQQEFIELYDTRFKNVDHIDDKMFNEQKKKQYEASLLAQETISKEELLKLKANLEADRDIQQEKQDMTLEVPTDANAPPIDLTQLIFVIKDIPGKIQNRLRIFLKILLLYIILSTYNFLHIPVTQDLDELYWRKKTVRQVLEEMRNFIQISFLQRKIFKKTLKLIHLPSLRFFPTSPPKIIFDPEDQSIENKEVIYNMNMGEFRAFLQYPNLENVLDYIFNNVEIKIGARKKKVAFLKTPPFQEGDQVNLDVMEGFAKQHQRDGKILNDILYNLKLTPCQFELYDPRTVTQVIRNVPPPYIQNIIKCNYSFGFQVLH